MRVNVNGGGRQVEIECGDANVTFDAVADKALEVWNATAGASRGGGPALGFASMERSPRNGSPRVEVE